MPNAANFSPEQKLDFIADQIKAIRSGELTWMLCPYCGHENTPVDEKVCCELFAMASHAVIDRLNKEEAIKFCETVQERAN